MSEAGKKPKAEKAPKDDKPAKAPKGEKPAAAAAAGDKPAAKGDAKPDKAAAKGKADKGGDKPAAKGKPKAAPAGGPARMRSHYDQVVRKTMTERFGYKNGMQVPKLNKIVLNIGAGEGSQDSKKMVAAQNDLTAIAGQKAIVTKAKKAISTFKITAGRPVGVKVTLRQDRMYEFLDRLVTMAMPRIRDFRGVNGKSFDGRGNYAMGLKEHIVFLEIDYDKTETVWGMDIIFNTSAKTDEEAKALLKGFQFPFVN